VLFNSALFILWFLPAFLLVYTFVPMRWKNLTALLSSMVFYAWGAPIFCFVLLLSGSIDFALSKKIATGKGRGWLAIGILINVLTLFVFKYFNFFVDNLRQIIEGLGMNFPLIAEVALPLGISFFTFQKLSYLIDVHRKTTPPAHSITDYLLFVFLFPQLIAGPIVRYKDLAEQINDRAATDTYAYKLAGFQRFVLGLVKKVFIADLLAPLADTAFATAQLDWFTAVLGLLAFTFQIYYDFSGYSDMAIGLGMLMGFRFPENFDWPYVARGFRDFWRRWHITLSTWLRDYLYYPLGGSRTEKGIVLRNLWIVFLISGLWHGASWHFVVWGAWHGLFISIDRYTNFFRRLNPVASALLTFALVSLGWVWFRSAGWSEALTYFQGLVAGGTADTMFVSSKQWVVLSVAIVFAFIPSKLHASVRAFHGENLKNLPLKTLIALAMLLMCLGQIGLMEAQPFIYFRF
jgi:alginate O-acetyltransferase complex protein AlgI